MTVSSGFADKLYWRPSGGSGLGIWHCYKRLAREDHFGLFGKIMKYTSLCGQHFLPRSGGQQIKRPIAMLRCARCDIAECERRGWDESGPETISPEDC